jgi:hypothetical protein
MIIVFTVEVVLLLLGYFYAIELYELFKDNLKESLNLYGKSNNTRITNAIDYFQTTLKCCAIEHPLDWKSTWWNENLKQFNDNYDFPKSCSSSTSTGCLTNDTVIEKRFSLFILLWLNFSFKIFSMLIFNLKIFLNLFCKNSTKLIKHGKKHFTFEETKNLIL